MGQGLRHGEIGVVKGHVLPYQGDLHRTGGVLGPVDHVGPLSEVRHMANEPQPPDHRVRQPLPLQHQRRLVEQVRRQVRDGVFYGNAAEKGNFLQNLPGHRRVGPAQDDVRLDAQAQQLLGGVLGGLRFQFSSAGNGDDEGDVDEHNIVPSPLRGYLSDGLQKGLALNIPHGAADLHNGYVGFRRVQLVDATLDLPGNVGDDLHRAPQIVPPPLPVKHIPVHLAGGYGGVNVQVLIDEPLVMAQIQIRLSAVVGDEDLPVLIRIHGTGVHVQIGVQLLNLHPQAPLLQKAAQGRGGNPLAQAGHHAAGDENIFDGHKYPSLLHGRIPSREIK